MSSSPIHRTISINPGQPPIRRKINPNLDSELPVPVSLESELPIPYKEEVPHVEKWTTFKKKLTGRAASKVLLNDRAILLLNKTEKDKNLVLCLPNFELTNEEKAKISAHFDKTTGSSDVIYYQVDKPGDLFGLELFKTSQFTSLD